MGVLRVEVVVALPRSEQVFFLELPEGATVEDALTKARLKAHSIGIFGERVAPERKLRDGDRVEVYRPLKMDPKEARRRRARR